MIKIANKLQKAGWNISVDVLLLTGYSREIKLGFSEHLSRVDIYSPSRWKCMYDKNLMNLPSLSDCNYYYGYKSLSFQNRLKISYACQNDINLSDVDNGFHTIRLHNHYNSMKEQYGENYWIELNIGNISLSKNRAQLTHSSSRILLIIKDWRFPYEFEYMNNLKEEGLIGGLHTFRIFTDDTPALFDSFLDNVTTDGVVFLRDNVLPIHSMMYKIKTKFPQFKDHCDAIDI